MAYNIVCKAKQIKKDEARLIVYYKLEEEDCKDHAKLGDHSTDTLGLLYEFQLALAYKIVLYTKNSAPLY
jgi:hypothetical protein